MENTLNKYECVHFPTGQAQMEQTPASWLPQNVNRLRSATIICIRTGTCVCKAIRRQREGEDISQIVDQEFDSHNRMEPIAQSHGMQQPSGQ